MSFVDKRACWMQVNSCDPLLTQCHIPVITLSALVLNYIALFKCRVYFTSSTENQMCCFCIGEQETVGLFVNNLCNTDWSMPSCILIFQQTNIALL